MASAEGSTIGTSLIAGALAVAAVFAVTNLYEWSRGKIAANERARVVARLNSVLDPTLRGLDLMTTRLAVTDAELLGSD
jgi:hypothetical protein